MDSDSKVYPTVIPVHCMIQWHTNTLSDTKTANTETQYIHMLVYIPPPHPPTQPSALPLHSHVIAHLVLPSGSLVRAGIIPPPRSIPVPLLREVAYQHHCLISGLLPWSSPELIPHTCDSQPTTGSKICSQPDGPHKHPILSTVPPDSSPLPSFQVNRPGGRASNANCSPAAHTRSHTPEGYMIYHTHQEHQLYRAPFW